MSLELEDRLERVADTLPAPTSDSRDRARSAALAALAQAPRRRRRRVVLLAPAVAVIVAVGAVAVLAAPWRDSPLATERALAALGHQPVVHAIVEQSSPRETVVDLASGRERLEAHRSEYWYDDERDLLRVRLSVGGRLLPGGEYLHSPEGFFTDRGVQRGQARPPRLDPALEGFASGYREALDSGEATVVGEEVVDGREAVILRFSLPSGPLGEQFSQDVAVDADDYRPHRFRFSSTAAPGRTSPWSDAPRVVEIETIPRDPRDFEAPPRSGEPRPAGQTGVDERKLEPAEAATALGRPVFWPGRAVEGVELAQIELMRLTTRWTDGRVTEGHALVFQYGADQRTAYLEGKPSLIMTEGTSTEETPRFDLGGSIPRPGELRLTGVGNADGSDVDMWFGGMQRDGVYISFQSPQRDLILAAAKAMVRLD
jgi:hypothetical protein